MLFDQRHAAVRKGTQHDLITHNTRSLHFLCEERPQVHRLLLPFSHGETNTVVQGLTPDEVCFKLLNAIWFACRVEAVSLQYT